MHGPRGGSRLDGAEDDSEPAPPAWYAPRVGRSDKAIAGLAGFAVAMWFFSRDWWLTLMTTAGVAALMVAVDLVTRQR